MMIQSKPRETSELSSRGTLLHCFPMSDPLENTHKLNKGVPALHIICLHYTTFVVIVVKLESNMLVMFRIKYHLDCIYVQMLTIGDKKLKDEITSVKAWGRLLMQ